VDRPALPELFVLDDVSLEVDGGRVLLDRLDEHLHAGAVTAICGPSGSGKSTLLRLLNRLSEPTSGRVLFHGEDVRGLDVRELRRRAVLVPQRAVALTDDVRSEVRAARRELSDDAVDELLQRVALAPGMVVGREPSSLSGGELQRLCLARALAVEPEVLLLDEPTSALDPLAADAVDAVIRSLRDEGQSVVLVSHDVARAESVATDVRVLHAGRVTARGPAGAVDLAHEMATTPDDGHEHGPDDPRAHGDVHRGHRHPPYDGMPDPTAFDHG
jgi:putative ABC transport system ATP-binding protein